MVPEDNTDKIKAWEKLQFNIIFKGDDWKGTSKWNKYEFFFKSKNVQVRYFPYTKNVSSTKLRELLNR